MKEITKGIYMKGNNELHMSEEAMKEAIETYWNTKIALTDEHKIEIDLVHWNPRTRKFVVLFFEKAKTRS